MAIIIITDTTNTSITNFQTCIIVWDNISTPVTTITLREHISLLNTKNSNVQLPLSTNSTASDHNTAVQVDEDENTNELKAHQTLAAEFSLLVKLASVAIYPKK